jgi:predicted DsbA family dithiol-disulfide isomerase
MSHPVRRVEGVAEKPPIAVEVFSDIVCPWCFIGERRFQRAVAELATDPDFPGLDYVFRPFQLDPRAPKTGVPAVDAYARKFGGPDGAAAVIARVTTAAAEEGLEFHLDRAIRTNTADAHRLLWWALQTAGPDAQHLLAEQLMLAYFTDGEDIGDPDVLARRAASCGLDPGRARELLAEEKGLEALAVGLRRAAELGITAVPTFVVDATWSIPGAQDTDVFVRLLRRIAEKRHAA